MQYHKVIQVIRHELYQGIRAETNSRADIAVLKISPPFNFNNVIQPVMLPERGHHFETDFATITGWGDTEVRVDYLLNCTINLLFTLHRLKINLK